MTIDFQTSVLKYLCQSSEARKYAELLDASLFDIPVTQLVFDLWKGFVTQYSCVPTQLAILEYFDRQLAAMGSGHVTPELKQEIVLTIKVLYTDPVTDAAFIQEVILDESRKKMTKDLIRGSVDKIDTGDDTFFTGLLASMGRIVNLKHNDVNKEQNRGYFTLADFGKIPDLSVTGHPTCLQALNRMTAAGGFHTPQLILFMGGPKAFKTGVMITLSVGYMKDGLKIYYADTENGIGSIQTRIYQALMGCQEHELKLLKPELAQVIAELIANGAGDIKTNFFPAGVSTLDDVDMELELLKEVHGWVPDLIVYDYLAKFAPTDRTIREKRLQIQHVQNHAVALNNKWDTFCFTAAPVVAAAYEKEVFNVADLGEDKAQAYNCHAAFGICRTEQESLMNTGRIVPIVQRAGTRYMHNGDTLCALGIDEPHMTITEKDPHAYFAAMESMAQPQPRGGGKGRGHSVSMIPLPNAGDVLFGKDQPTGPRAVTIPDRPGAGIHPIAPNLNGHSKLFAAMDIEPGWGDDDEAPF